MITKTGAPYIWVDTTLSNTGVEPSFDGTCENPVSTWGAALELSRKTKIERFRAGDYAVTFLEAKKCFDDEMRDLPDGPEENEETQHGRHLDNIRPRVTNKELTKDVRERMGEGQEEDSGDQELKKSADILRKALRPVAEKYAEQRKNPDGHLLSRAINVACTLPAQAMWRHRA